MRSEPLFRGGITRVAGTERQARSLALALGAIVARAAAALPLALQKIQLTALERLHLRITRAFGDNTADVR